MLDKIRIKGYKSIRELELKLKPINILHIQKRSAML